MVFKRHVDVSAVHWIQIYFGKHPAVVIGLVDHLGTVGVVVLVYSKLMENNVAWLMFLRDSVLIGMLLCIHNYTKRQIKTQSLLSCSGMVPTSLPPYCFTSTHQYTHVFCEHFSYMNVTFVSHRVLLRSVPGLLGSVL